MKSKKLLLVTLLGVFSTSTFLATTAYADSGMYPPEDLFAPNKYPPQTSSQNTWNRAAPRTVPNFRAPNFNSIKPQRPAAPNISQPQFRNYSPRYNQAYPQRGYVPNARMPNNRYPSYSSNRRNSPFSGNNMPFNNFSNGNNNFPFNSGSMPFMNNGNNSFGNLPTNPFGNMFGNNSNNSYNKMPFFGNTRSSNRKKAWGEERHIWPDFYTDFTDDAWDSASSGPRDLGVMPGGWRFPHISTPDPVTVSDAITNQFPPILEEAGKMMDISDWGVFEDK